MYEGINLDQATAMGVRCCRQQYSFVSLSVFPTLYLISGGLFRSDVYAQGLSLDRATAMGVRCCRLPVLEHVHCLRDYVLNLTDGMKQTQNTTQ